MSVSVSYRLNPELKTRLAERAAAEGVSETLLVARLLDEGLKAAGHPGVVYRSGPAGRRAGLAGGPDVWEVISAIRHAPGRGDKKVVEAAAQMGVAERLVRMALSFAASYPDEVEASITANDAAVENAQRVAEARARLLAS